MRRAMAAALFALGGVAEARTLHVPAEQATIQEAINAAGAGDEIRVAAGQHCGATVTRRVSLTGEGATIIGCDTGPTLFDGLRVGFLLPAEDGDSPATGTRISGFTFDGAGVSEENLDPLAFGVFARFADDVEVIGNVFKGTVQAITNTAGDRWSVTENEVVDLALFDCAGRCGGGSAIVVQAADGELALLGGSLNPGNRPEGNTIAQNEVSGALPAGFDTFSMAGVLLIAADRTVVFENRFTLTAPAPGDAVAAGVLVSSTHPGDPTPAVPGARDTTILKNDGQASQYLLLVRHDGSKNTSGLTVDENQGQVLVED